MKSLEVIAFLKSQVTLFKDFSDVELGQLESGSRVVHVDPNELIVEFGEEGRFLGVVLDGEAEVSVTDDGGDKHPLGNLRAGDIFGEVALMTGDLTAADVVAVTPCRVLLIPRPVFAALIASNLAAVSALSKMIIQRMKAAAEAGAPADPGAFKRTGDPYGFKLKTERPMTILVINCGSSSLKFNLFDTWDKTRNARGVVDRLGQEDAVLHCESGKGSVQTKLPGAGHGEAFAAMIDSLTARDTGMLTSLSAVSAVGHRVVHGGNAYSHQVIITDEVIQGIEQAAALAPLHNPVNLTGIREAQRRFPDIPHVAVFDTAFHQAIPAFAYLYGLSYQYCEEKGIRRYGFHGISHKYASLKAAEALQRRYNELEIIVCHLGNGASVCAVDHGRSVDTSMGMTPTEGLIMGTRCGDLDPAILVHLMRTEGCTADDLHRIINQEGGLKGLSGVSNDMRAIEAAADAGHPRALLALKTFAYRVRKYIGAYAAAMGGVDAVVFTGGIGQGSVWARSLACQGLHAMGIGIDEEKNRAANGFEQVCDITAEGSSVRVLVVPADEERMIARETLRALERSHVSTILHSQTPMPVPIEISAHHVHLMQAHVEALFGPGHVLTPYQPLSQPGQYACQEKVNLIGPRGRVENVRVLGPARKQTQVEIAMTEQFKLGIHPPIRESGSLDGTPGITLEGPQGTVSLDHGVICAARHIHMNPEEALRMGLKDKDVVTVRVPGDRELVFGDVLARVHPDFKLAMHLDTDEGNAANLAAGAVGYVDGIQSRR
jgi:acetate kinase